MTHTHAIGGPYSATNGLDGSAGGLRMDGVSGASYGVPAIIMELGYRGIIVPADAQRARTTCPECSRTRRKASDKCLRINIISPTRARMNCKHCPYRDEVTA